jgi:hypothetical protein
LRRPVSARADPTRKNSGEAGSNSSLVFLQNGCKEYLTLCKVCFTLWGMKFKSKYTLRTTIGFIAYGCGVWGWQHFALQHSHSPYRYCVVLLPVLPIIYLTAIVHRKLSEKDEMWRKIITESLAFSATASAWSCLSYMFLRAMGAPEFHAEWAFYTLVAYYLIGFFLCSRRYFSCRRCE